MPAHDWSKVIHSYFHDFHMAWIIHLKEALNEGILPEDHYALAEQFADDVHTDVLTLRAVNGKAAPDTGGHPQGPEVCTLAAAPPSVRFCLEPKPKPRTSRKRIVVRHASDDQVVAMIEVVSPGNKSARDAMDSFVKKSVRLILKGVHLLIVDVLLPGKRDPRGMHPLIWRKIDESQKYTPPEGKPLTLASYRGNPGVRAYIEPFAVGDELTAMPLFLDMETYVKVPLEQTYLRTVRALPSRVRKCLES